MTAALIVPFGKFCERAQKRMIYYADILIFFLLVRGKDQDGTLLQNFFFFGVQEHPNFPSVKKDHMQETRQAYPDSLEVGL